MTFTLLPPTNSHFVIRRALLCAGGMPKGRLALLDLGLRRPDLVDTGSSNWDTDLYGPPKGRIKPPMSFADQVLTACNGHIVVILQEYFRPRGQGEQRRVHSLRVPRAFPGNAPSGVYVSIGRSNGVLHVHKCALTPPYAAPSGSCGSSRMCAHVRSATRRRTYADLPCAVAGEPVQVPAVGARQLRLLPPGGAAGVGRSRPEAGQPRDRVVLPAAAALGALHPRQVICLAYAAQIIAHAVATEQSLWQQSGLSLWTTRFEPTHTRPGALVPTLQLCICLQSSVAGDSSSLLFSAPRCCLAVGLHLCAAEVLEHPAPSGTADAWPYFMAGTPTSRICC